MNSRGAMEIILGLLALEYGIIHEHLFVALVIMALGTTMLSGPVMEWMIREKKPLKLINLLKPSGYIKSLESTSRRDVIMELANTAARETNIEGIRIYKSVWEREEIMGTALGGGIAVPHARLTEISAPVVVAGYSDEGIDFDAIDGAPAKLIFMLLTPARDQSMQLQILADIARIFSDPHARTAALQSHDYTSFINAISLAPEKKHR
jgi:mannitol/fructose-specific phosphotransferase system IIA component (Ntr-type)